VSIECWNGSALGQKRDEFLMAELEAARRELVAGRPEVARAIALYGKSDKLVYNSDRDAIQVLACGGEISVHLPLHTSTQVIAD
jgi:hypothetical protein